MPLGIGVRSWRKPSEVLWRVPGFGSLLLPSEFRIAPRLLGLRAQFRNGRRKGSNHGLALKTRLSAVART